jgi:Protein phosphatase 2C
LKQANGSLDVLTTDHRCGCDVVLCVRPATQCWNARASGVLCRLSVLASSKRAVSLRMGGCWEFWSPHARLVNSCCCHGSLPRSLAVFAVLLLGDLDEKARPGVVIATPDVRYAVLPVCQSLVFENSFARRSVAVTMPNAGKSAPHAGLSAPKLGILPGSAKPTLSSTSLVGKAKLTPAEIVVLVVATDGVWDVLPPASVIALATQTLQLTRDPHQAALAITRAAANHGSVDDITATVVWFQ